MAAEKGMDAAGIGGEDDYTTEGGAARGAAQGASIGTSIGGPGWGTVIGATIGGIQGGLQAKAKRKAYEKQQAAKFEAKRLNQLAQLEDDKEKKIQGALNNMKNAFSQSLRSQQKVRL
jgi:outer membrane lipoprotein SlyB